jgi:predicted Zn-dependent protease
MVRNTPLAAALSCIDSGVPMFKSAIAITLLTILAGCAANPVTGKSELSLVSHSQEIEIGRENYLPARQSQGGDYKAHPEVTRYVNQVGQRMAAVSDRRLPYEFVVINDSTPNAWALPGGKIAVNRGLLVELDDEAELAAVLGHEIVHAAARHGAQGIERGILLQSAVAATSIAAGSVGYGDIANSGAQLAAGMVNQKYGRDAELESDYYGMQYLARAGYDPRAAVSLQQKFVELSQSQAQNWLSGLFASHPPSQERVTANRRTAGQLAHTGELGAARYQQAILPLTRSEAAYRDYDEGRKALSEGHPREALAKANRAISREPREALFYALKGDAKAAQGRQQDAVRAYSKALSLDDGYFYYHLQRGLARERLGQYSAARRDLRASLELLPTVNATAALGELELAEGNTAGARAYLRQAASSDSEAGRRAAATLARLDIGSDPNALLQVRVGLDRGGYLLVEVRNPTSVAVTDVILTIRFKDARGRLRNANTRVPGVLRSGQGRRVSTGAGPFSRAALNDIQVSVAQARVTR